MSNTDERHVYFLIQTWRHCIYFWNELYGLEILTTEWHICPVFRVLNSNVIGFLHYLLENLKKTSVLRSSFFQTILS
jgi:hypothetical protein